MLSRRGEHGLRLYNKNVLIQEDNKDLLPNHLRFLEGVVDSEDLPLNVSRETVQRNPALRRIQKALAGRVTRALGELGEEDPDAYQDFWREFGYYLKEGIATDPLSREDLLPLLRFQSSRSEGRLIALQEYASRMQPDQRAIYYVLGESLSSVARSPHLDYFQAHDVEVLYLVDPLDGFVVQNLREYEGKPLKNVDDAGLELPVEGEGPEPESAEVPDSRLEALLARIQAVLGGRVSQVRMTRLLTNSPARLVSAESGPERDFQRLRHMIEEDFEVPPKIMEINPAHPLILGLEQVVREQPDSPRLTPVIEQLFENLLLLEGLHPNPAAMVPRLQALLEAAVLPPEGGELPERDPSA
jgi:molecular chaperone HtpG